MIDALVEKLKKIKWIYSDIDGTIIDDERRDVSPKTIEVIKKLKERGYKFGLISGRSSCLSNYELDVLQPNLPYIGCNGAQIFDIAKKESVFFQPLDLEFVKKSIEELLKRDLSFLLYAEKKSYYYLSTTSEYSRKNLIHNMNMHFLKSKSEFEEYSSDLLEKNFSHFTVYTPDRNEFCIPASLIKLGESYSVQTIRGPMHFFDVCSTKVDKGSGLKFVLEKEKIELENVLVFGDSYNDLPVFKIAGFPVAMKQAEYAIKKFAITETDFDNNHDGLANFIEEKLFRI